MAPFLHDGRQRGPWNIYVLVILWPSQFCMALFGSIISLMLLTFWELSSDPRVAAIDLCLSVSIVANFLVMGSLVYEAHHYYMASLTPYAYVCMQIAKVLWCAVAFAMMMVILPPSPATRTLAQLCISYCLPFVCALVYGVRVRRAVIKEEADSIANSWESSSQDHSIG